MTTPFNPYQRPRNEPVPPPPWSDPWRLGEVERRPFPLDALPSRLRAAVEHLAASRIVHPVVPFTAYCGAISGVLAEGTTVTLSTTWSMPVNVYALVVASSGDGKSPAFQGAADLIASIEQRRCELVAVEVAEAKARLIELTDEINTAAGKGKGKDRLFRDPVRLRLLVAERDQAEQIKRRTGRLSVQDATPESTAGLMARNGGVLVVVDAEGAIVHHALGMYSTAPNIGLWLAGWSGETYMRDRVREDGASEVIVPGARIGVGAAIQPGVMRSLLNDPRVEDRGFLARALTDWPPPMAGQRELSNLDHHPDDSTHLDPLHEHVIARWEECRSTPRYLTLSTDARMMYIAWHDARERELRTADESHVKVVPKVRASVARLAAVFHDLSDADSTVVEAATMTDAITIGDYYLAHRESTAATALLGDARHVLDWLATIGSAKKPVRTTTVRDVCRGARWYKYAGGTRRTIEALTLLSDYGWVRVVANRSVTLHPRLRRFAVTPTTPGDSGDSRDTQTPSSNQTALTVPVVPTVPGGRVRIEETRRRLVRRRSRR
jgi:replicative DNA helicase